MERSFNSTYDGPSYDGNTTTLTKAIPVGQSWYCTTKNGNVIYEMETLDIVQIEPKFLGFVFCEDGFTLSSLVSLGSACRSHFIIFDIKNYDVEKIFDGDISW